MQGERKKSRLIGWIILILGILMAVKSSANIIRLWRAGSRVEESVIAVKNAETENENLRKRLAEVQKPDFLEKEAREKLGLGRPGEEIVVLPEENSAQDSVLSAQEETVPNWRKWWNLYIKI